MEAPIRAPAHSPAQGFYEMAASVDIKGSSVPPDLPLNIRLQLPPLLVHNLYSSFHFCLRALWALHQYQRSNYCGELLQIAISMELIMRKIVLKKKRFMWRRPLRTRNGPWGASRSQCSFLLHFKDFLYLHRLVDG